MRHATVWATVVIFDWAGAGASRYGGRNACDWKVDPRPISHDFTARDAALLINGEKATLPTCPACAALVDLALEMRGMVAT